MGDEATIWELMREFYSFEHLPFDEPRGRAALGRLLGDPGLGRAWRIEAGGHVAGYLVVTFGYSLEFHGRDAFVDELYLREEFRGHGLGRRAIEVAEAECRASGIAALHLEVERKNTPAQAFYRRMGFADHDRYLMTKRLADR
jgi:ribosomal protein S18 acetylase RimI-like enzyme